MVLQQRKTEKLFSLVSRGYTLPPRMFGWVVFGWKPENHQNFDPSLLHKKLWLIFMGMKQKNPNGRLKKTEFFKTATSHFFFFMKISGIGPWVSRINWCEGHGSKFWWLPWFPIKNNLPQTFLGECYINGSIVPLPSGANEVLQCNLLFPGPYS